MMKKAFEVVTKLGTIPVVSLPHIDQNILKKVSDSKKFKDYVNLLNNPQNGVQVSQIQLLGVQMFGDKVGFVNLRAVTTKDGFKLPSYVFLRGAAVAVLMIVNGKLLLVQQYRVPAQRTFLEAPAGMIDESGDFIGVAAKQIEQQTGIKLTHDKLIPLGSYYPSVGGCDEQLIMYYCEINIPNQQLKAIEQKIHGQGEHERIKVKLVDYDPLTILKSKDSKLISLAYAYQNKKKIKVAL